MHAYTSLQLKTVCTSVIPLSKQLVTSEAPLEDAHHFLSGLGLRHQVRPVGLVQQLHEGLRRGRIHYGR